MEHILAVGADASLLYTRHLVLEQSGGLVESATADQALRLLANSAFALVVLCHSVHADDLLKLCTAARLSGGSTRVLLLDAIGALHQPAVDVDYRFALEDGPEVLLKVVRALLEEAAHAAHDAPGSKLAPPSESSPISALPPAPELIPVSASSPAANVSPSSGSLIDRSMGFGSRSNGHPASAHRLPPMSATTSFFSPAVKRGNGTAERWNTPPMTVLKR